MISSLQDSQRYSLPLLFPYTFNKKYSSHARDHVTFRYGCRQRHGHLHTRYVASRLAAHRRDQHAEAVGELLRVSVRFHELVEFPTSVVSLADVVWIIVDLLFEFLVAL